ncbi:hypothetical protein KZX46_00625 (plasmid) [Polymorphobacter sp. PAMC 29334]|uniref:hypothetical protein n=1 Tax=Polymorphobacter sp. PAMC 29334 TaxID=2862331 RepID=UPI001C77C7E9|nr:hypothetical protein [Polymorphobacter sp. PAMC 29334]QYE33342.1 hypothetical protein KZX46_00625 [Polymorphobacter sp. PAMC 29334]
MRVECWGGIVAAMLIFSPVVAQVQTPGSGTLLGAASALPPPDGMGAEPVGDFPKLSLATLANLEYSGLGAASGPSRGPQPYFRFDTTMLVDVSDKLSFDGLFQFKARKPRPADDPNRDLYINQGAGRRVGGKMLELYARYDTWRVGKFVQNFGRAYYLLPGPFSADFIEEAEAGYEPTEMIGVEKLHVFGNEDHGWQQLSVSVFFVDRTFLHESLPYNEGIVHYRDGGVGNTHLPENVMVTYDVLNMPVGHGAQATFQASVIRYGKSYQAQRGEIWTTLGSDIAIPINGSVAATLEGRYSQLHLYVEAARRDNFEGFAGRARNYVSVSADYLAGPWVVALTTTQRWTTDRVLPIQNDAIYTATIGHDLSSAILGSLSVAQEHVGDRSGVYAGIRLTKTFTTCARCLTRGRAF